MSSDYHPLLDTLRLYAGWLLACLFVVYALGSYQETRSLPYTFSILNEWVESPLILQVTFVTFVFLILSSVYRLLGKGVWKSVLLTIIGFALIVIFRANS